MKPARRFRLEPGLQETLTDAIGSRGKAKLEAMAAEITAGEISDQTRHVLSAWGWISSERDARLSPVIEPPKPKVP